MADINTNQDPPVVVNISEENVTTLIQEVPQVVSVNVLEENPIQVNVTQETGAGITVESAELGTISVPENSGREMTVNVLPPNQLSIGITGDGDKFWLYEQRTPAAIWVIDHNLNKKPSVTVVDGDDRQVYGVVKYISNTQLQIHFSASFSGVAYLN